MKKTINVILLLVIVALAVLFYFLDPIKHYIFPNCMFHSLTGAYCPGCGSQRALHSLLHLDFASVVGYNFLFLPAAIFILYHYLHTFVNKLFNWNLPNLFYKKQTPWVVLILVLLFWVARNLPFYPFTLLAPG